MSEINNKRVKFKPNGAVVCLLINPRWVVVGGIGGYSRFMGSRVRVADRGNAIEFKSEQGQWHKIQGAVESIETVK